MNRILITTLLLVASLAANAQRNDSRRSDDRRSGERNTIFGGDVDVSAFGGPILELGDIGGEFGSFMGGGGALLFNDRFYIGGYGQGLNNNPVVLLDETLSGTATLDMRHGGFWAGAIIWPERAVHPTISGRAGWGKAQLYDDGTGSLGRSKAEDNIFVLSPMAGIEANITGWFTIRGEYGYRFVQGTDLPGLSSSSLDGSFASITLAFGGFGR